MQSHAFARFLVAGSPEEATSHGDAVIGWERAVGLYVKGAIKGLALREPLINHLLVLVYSARHIVASVAALAFRRPRDQARFRW